MNTKVLDGAVQSEATARQYLQRFCWNNYQRFCPRCSSRELYRLSSGRKRCKRCRYTFSEFCGRWLSQSRLNCCDWVVLVRLFEKERSVEEIARVLGRAYATVFHAVTVLRACILAHSDTCGALLHDDPSMLQRVCSHRGRKTLRLDGHVPVFGIRENSGKAFVPVLPDVSPDFVLKLPVVDGRARDYYYGWIKAPLAERPGTLPDAINLEHRRLIEPDTGRFLHPEALTIVLREAGIDPQRETVVFCNVGHWSAAIWFALSEIAGFENVTLYDGSMVEWSASPERPVWIPEDPAWD